MAQRPVVGVNGVAPKRSFSLSRGPSNLFLRLSGRRQKSVEDGGVNGNWGPDSEEVLPQAQQQQPPRQYQQQNQQHQQQYQQHPQQPPPQAWQQQRQQPGAPAIPAKVPVNYTTGYGQQVPRLVGRGNGAQGGIRYGEDDQSTVSSVEEVPGGGRYMPQQVRIRGGAGSPAALGAGVGGDYSHNEFEDGDESYFSVQRRPVGAGRSQAAPDVHGTSGTTLEASEGGAGPPIRPFYRTPTGLKGKQAKKRDFEVNLEGGLDIRLNVEVNPKDPSGITVPYRLVVPRLWYTYQPEDLGSKAPTGLKRLLSMGRKPAPQHGQEQEQVFHPGQSESGESTPLGEHGGMME